jgi:acetyl-CoA/propionyl-CoA carboxylase biotin carboxyl carrier protein
MMMKLEVTIDGRVFEIELPQRVDGQDEIHARVNGETVLVRLPAQEPGELSPDWIMVGDRPYEVSFDRSTHAVRSQGRVHQIHVRDLDAPSARGFNGDSRVRAPIPGIVNQVLISPGQHVEAGQTLFILEAMKMENQIRAPRGGTVTALSASPGQGVALHQILAEII